MNSKLTHRRTINSKYATSDQERAGQHGPWRSKDGSRELSGRRNLFNPGIAALLLDHRIRSRQNILWNRQADPSSGF